LPQSILGYKIYEVILSLKSIHKIYHAYDDILRKPQDTHYSDVHMHLSRQRKCHGVNSEVLLIYIFMAADGSTSWLPYGPAICGNTRVRKQGRCIKHAIQCECKHVGIIYLPLLDTSLWRTTQLKSGGRRSAYCFNLSR